MFVYAYTDASLTLIDRLKNQARQSAQTGNISDIDYIQYYCFTVGPQTGSSPLHLVLAFCNMALSHSSLDLANLEQEWILV